MALALAIAVYVAAWLGFAFWLKDACGWMAVTAAPTMLATLRLTRVPPGTMRGALATGATAVAIACANRLVIAMPLADAMGMPVTQAAARIGPHFAWTLIEVSHTWLDWAWVALALALAWSAWAGGRRDRDV